MNKEEIVAALLWELHQAEYADENERSISTDMIKEILKYLDLQEEIDFVQEHKKIPCIIKIETIN